MSLQHRDIVARYPPTWTGQGVLLLRAANPTKGTPYGHGRGDGIGRLLEKCQFLSVEGCSALSTQPPARGGHNRLVAERAATLLAAAGGRVAGSLPSGVCHRSTVEIMARNW